MPQVKECTHSWRKVRDVTNGDLLSVGNLSKWDLPRLSDYVGSVFVCAHCKRKLYVTKRGLKASQYDQHAAIESAQLL